MAGSMTLMLAALAAPAGSGAPLTAEQAIEAYHATFAGARPRACGPSAQSEEVVVCGRRDADTPRLPLPVEPEPGARSTGEAAPATDALALGAERCSTVGPNSQCTGTVPIIPIAIWIVQTAIKAAKEGD
jgi:hypothetical protein